MNIKADQETATTISTQELERVLVAVINALGEFLHPKFFEYLNIQLNPQDTDERPAS